MADYQSIIDILITGDEDNLRAETQAALDGGLPAEDILSEGLMKGMDIIGEKMENQDMFIPEVLMCAKAMAGALEILKPQLGDDKKTSAGKVVIGTVKGDLHDIGKNLVSLMLESAGFEVTDLGVDVSADKFVSEAKAIGADVVCLSALLTTTMPAMKQTVDSFVASGLREKVKVMVGGAPVTQAFADEIGADGYAPDAGAAVKKAKSLLPKAA